MKAKEALTQAEKDKLAIDPDFDFKKLAEKSFADLTPNEIGMFKWSGVYHQLQTKYFMIRLRMPAGILTSEQLMQAAKLAKEYAQNQLCITTRQCLQFHWVRLQDIYKILDGMKNVGILTKNACGDVCRNVTSCSLQGVCPHEICETRKIIDAIADDPVILDQQRNLPRKHKISVSGCEADCGHPLINCQAWTPVVQEVDGAGTVGWKFHAGGGLGSLPHLAKSIFDWVPEHLVVEVAKATIEIHNKHGNRRLRRYARLKIIVDQYGPKGFANLVLQSMKEGGVSGLEEIVIAESSDPVIKPNPFAGQCVIPQKNNDLKTVRVMIPRSEISGDEAGKFANFAEKYGNGELAMTVRQNVELRNIRSGNVDTLTEDLKQAGYRLEGFEHLPDIVSCVGTTMCNLAVADTPLAYHSLLDELGNDQELMRRVGPLRINLNGCPNSCGQHWVADIGLRGMRLPKGHGSEEGFGLYVGGGNDGPGHIGELVANVPAHGIAETVRRMLEIYLENRAGDLETFKDFSHRVRGKGFEKLLMENLPECLIVPENEINLELAELFKSVYEDVK